MDMLIHTKEHTHIHTHGTTSPPPSTTHDIQTWAAVCSTCLSVSASASEGVGGGARSHRGHIVCLRSTVPCKGWVNYKSWSAMQSEGGSE
jgi:hypothetical protein